MAPTSPCSLPPDALQDRLVAWRALDTALVGADRTPTGAVLRYRLEPAVVAALLDLIASERQCCPSLAFEPVVTVRIEAPEAMRAWLASAFVAHRPEPVGPAPDAGAATADPATIKDAVRTHYAAAAEQGTCCDPSAGCTPAVVGPGVYDAEDRHALPERVVASSIGCANPVAAADLATGETVLDLGCGGGLDVLLAARRVGPTGKAYGLDMTEEMLQLARRHQADVGVDNAEFLQGEIEEIPLPDESVDVIVSNCVLGLSVDKEAVMAEAYRLLRPGGRLVVADVVAQAEASPERRADVDSWVACLAGALTRSHYGSALEGAGFTLVSIDEDHPISEGFDSVVVRAVKPLPVSGDDVPAAVGPRPSPG